MEKNHSMQRLLEGDVGTGKTIVSLIATIHAIKISERPVSKETGLGGNGAKIQVAIMAPTEILARQHFASTQNMLIEFGLTSHLLV
jgi:ATP-dependent DNA helicase RecG